MTRRRPWHHLHRAVVPLVLATLLLPGTVAAAGGLVLPPALAHGDAAVPLADLPADTAEQLAGAAMVDVGGGCSGVLIAPAATVAPDAPAYVLTNGHCIDILSPTEVRRDQPGEGSVTFGWPGGPRHLDVPVAAIRWASMKGTDLAVLELDRTLAELVDGEGLPAYRLVAAAAAPGTEVAIVGAPAPDDGSDRQLTLATCTLGPAVDLVEDIWAWHAFPANACAGIRHGSSGSPVLDVRTGALVGLVNTGTSGSAGRSDCMFDRPCEVRPASARSVEDAVYGPSVAGLAACFDAGGRFVGPGGDCPLDPGIGLEVEDAVVVTNPDVHRPDGRPSRGTWGARLVAPDASLSWYRAKAGALGAVDCRDPDGYGTPVGLAQAPTYDAPLPDVEGRYQLCLLAGPGPVVDGRWQSPRFATIVTAWVDKTPPLPPVDISITGTPEGWTASPVPVPPELEAFTWKAGPAATTRCTDPGGYRFWRHAPIHVAAADAPARLCVIGYDPAGNPSPVLDRELATDGTTPDHG